MSVRDPPYFFHTVFPSLIVSSTSIFSISATGTAVGSAERMMRSAGLLIRRPMERAETQPRRTGQGYKVFMSGVRRQTSDVEREAGRAAAWAEHGRLLGESEAAGEFNPQGIQREIDVEEKEAE